MGFYAVGPSTYDLLENLLEILWRNDDILFEEDCREAKEKADTIASVLIAGDEIRNILNRAEDDWLDQESLFELQDMVGEMAEEYARMEHRLGEFHKKFPWLRGGD